MVRYVRTGQDDSQESVGQDLTGYCFIGSRKVCFGVALEIYAAVVAQTGKVLHAPGRLTIPWRKPAMPFAMVGGFGGCLPGAMEIMDRLSIGTSAEAAKRRRFIPKVAKAILIVELEGTADEVDCP